MDDNIKTYNRKSVKIGLVTLGLNTYWSQFTGLYERLLGYKNYILSLLNPDAIILDMGMIDNTDKALEATEKLKGVDLMVFYVSTYCVSSTLIPFLTVIKVPYLVLNLQPSSVIDFAKVNALQDKGKATGEWLAYCQACAIPEITYVLKRSGLQYHIITGHLQDPKVREQLSIWTSAAQVAIALRNSHIGILGNYYNGMLDIYSDIRGLSLTFGSHFDLIEICELKKLRNALTNTEIEKELTELRSVLDISPQCDTDEINRVVRTFAAIRKLSVLHSLGGLAYYYDGAGDHECLDIITSMIAGSTIMTGSGIPIAGECDIKNVIAMKIMALMGGGGSFSEFYCIDFDNDVVLLGHDGPAHPMVSNTGVSLVPLPVYHGKPGKGLSIQMSVRHGDVTLLSVCEDDKGVFLLYAEGESVEGETLNIGNTNSRYRFKCGARDFINLWSMAGPSHHCTIGIGHKGATIEALASLLSIRAIKI